MYRFRISKGVASVVCGEEVLHLVRSVMRGKGCGGGWAGTNLWVVIGVIFLRLSASD